MRFTFYGHSCFSIETEGINFLFDPFITDNPLAQEVNIMAIKADYILISHGHGDHVSDLLTIAKNTQATVIATFEIAEWVQKQGYDKVHPINFGSKDFDFGKLRFVSALHSSSLPDGTYGGNPGGFIITNNEGSFYFSGDTSLTMDMKLIPEWTKLDFAVLPIGGNFTMAADDAVKAAKMIQCNKIIGIHFDTFEPIKIDHEATRNLFREANIDLILPTIGESINL